MGLSASKFSDGGTLRGAFAPPLPGIVLPERLDPVAKTYSVTVPDDKGPGDKMTFVIKGHEVSITIPIVVKSSYGSVRKIRSGDKFSFVWGDRDRVIASTLPSLPGAVVVEAKPILWANVSHAFRQLNWNDQKEQTSMSKQVGTLMQEAQTMLLQKAVECGCNAVLSISSNVSTDSSGDEGNSKLVIVTMIGTPCVVMPASEMPVVNAQATMVPDFQW